MKLWLGLLMVFAAVSCIYAAVGRAHSPDPNNPSGCIYEGVGPLKQGESKVSPTGCSEISCAGNGDITITSCGSVAAAPGCQVVTNDKEKYPKCCPTIACN